MAFNQNLEIVGLTNVSYAVPQAGAVFVKGKVQLPRLAAGGTQSSVVVTITDTTTSSTLYTGLAGADGFYVDAAVAAGDVIQVATASSAAGDAVLNAVKTQIQIGNGI